MYIPDTRRKKLILSVPILLVAVQLYKAVFWCCTFSSNSSETICVVFNTLEEIVMVEVLTMSTPFTLQIIVGRGIPYTKHSKDILLFMIA